MTQPKPTDQCELGQLVRAYRAAMAEHPDADSATIRAIVRNQYPCPNDEVVLAAEDEMGFIVNLNKPETSPLVDMPSHELAHRIIGKIIDELAEEIAASIVEHLDWQTTVTTGRHVHLACELGRVLDRMDQAERTDLINELNLNA